VAQHYSDPRRESMPHALPDIETFQHICSDTADECAGGGWYWWSCFPGGMPDSDPRGPFDTEDAALADAREGVDTGDGESGEGA
jgi:hypothetical protein